MQKIVFGILLVFFVQIGFQIFTAVQLTNEEYAAIAPAASPVDPGIEYARIDDGQPAAVAGQSVQANLNTRPEKGRSIEPVRTVQRRPVRELKPLQAKAIFPPVIITTQGMGYSVERASFTTASAVEPKKNKSLPAKALKVVKKPFDWLKSAVSKLR